MSDYRNSYFSPSRKNIIRAWWEWKINKSKDNGGFLELIAVLSVEDYGGASLSLAGLATDSRGTCNYNQRQAGNEIVDFRASLDACNCHAEQHFLFFFLFKTFSPVPKAD